VFYARVGYVPLSRWTISELILIVFASCSLCSTASVTCLTSTDWSMSCSRSTSIIIFYIIIQLLWLDRHEVHAARQTLAELAVSVSLDLSARALMIALCILYQTTPQCTKSPVYFHASATPPQFLAPLYYDTRFLLGRSRVIKCPSLPLQLAGGKKVRKHSRGLVCSNTS
jgi:hypothetical protein